MGKIIYPRKGEVHTAPVTIPAVFADATWEQIIECCETNTVPATWEVGDQKAMTINGPDYLIDIIGKNHDAYYGGGTAPLTFQMHDLYATYYQMYTNASNHTGWHGCDMYLKHLPSLLALMPSEVQAGIKGVRKTTSMGNQWSNLRTTNEKLFLLSEVEIFGTITNSVSGEGEQYAYYSAGNSKAKMLHSSYIAYWWTRSPYSMNALEYCTVSTGGQSVHHNANFATIGVSFAFCF